LTLSAVFFVAIALPGPSAQLFAPGLGCHAKIDVECSPLRGEEALRCRNEADAQCDIADAEQFIAVGRANDAVSRVDMACSKYEDLLNMMLVDDGVHTAADTGVRYAAALASIFALLAREGEVEDLTQAVLRLEKGRQFLVNLTERRGELLGYSDLVAALADLTKRLAASLDQLARQEMRRAYERFRERPGSRSREGGAASYYEDAANHSAGAYALVSTFAYKVVEFDAELAQAELHTVLGRDDREAAARACQGHRKLRHELADIERSAPRTWKDYPQLRDFQTRAERGTRACAARPRLVVGGVMVGIGAAALGMALGLYAQYDAACNFSPARGACLGIVAGSPESDRYIAQVRASIGLAVVGGALFATGATVLIHGGLQRKRAQPRRFSITPTFGPNNTGAAFGLRF